MQRCLLAVAFLATLISTNLASASIWTPDPAKAGWGEDEIYGAYARWVNRLPEDQLQNAYDRMKAIAKRNPGGSMDAMLKAQIWDCSSTAIYIWVRFLYEERLPMLLPVYIVGEGGGDYVTYSHASEKFESVADREDRFLYFVKLLQNVTYVHDLSSDLTYPIKFSALQGGTVNLSKTHTRVISGVDRDPQRSPMLVTGQWIYTSRWAASTAFAQLEAHQQDAGELGLRLFRVTVREGDGYRLKPSAEHKRFGGLQQNQAGNAKFREALFRANGVPYHDSMLLKFADTIFAEWMEYRNLYIKTHPYPQYSHEHATTQANDQRIVRLYEEMAQIENRPDVIAELGTQYLSRTSFPIKFTDFKGWSSTGNISVRLFGEAFRMYQPRLSNPQEPLERRMLMVQDFLNAISAQGSSSQMLEFVNLIKGSGQKINLRENRVWIRRMSPEAQMELTPYLEF